MPSTGAHKIGADKARAPRNHVEGVVFTFGARKKQELPFIVGVMSDLSGLAPTKPKPPGSEASAEERGKYEEELKRFEAWQRTKKDFKEIDSGNFDGMMKTMRPKVSIQVPNRLSKDGGTLPVTLEFESMADFQPDRVAAKVGPLKELLEQRQLLQNLSASLDGKEDAEVMLSDLLRKVDALSK